MKHPDKPQRQTRAAAQRRGDRAGFLGMQELAQLSAMPARKMTFDRDGWSACKRYYIRRSWDEREAEDVYKAFYRPDAATIEELTDWTWARDACVAACERHAAGEQVQP